MRPPTTPAPTPRSPPPKPAERHGRRSPPTPAGPNTSPPSPWTARASKPRAGRPPPPRCSAATPPPPPARALRTIDTDIGPIRALDVAITDDAGQSIAVATLLAPLDPSRYAATNALTRTLIAGAIALLLAGGLLTVVVRRSLRPLRDLSMTAAAIRPDTLTARVPVPDTNDEVQQLATS
ncbi:MAG: HAMP domain-containing protein [Acidimicrobiales bacterium]